MYIYTHTHTYIHTYIHTYMIRSLSLLIIRIIISIIWITKADDDLDERVLQINATTNTINDNSNTTNNNNNNNNDNCNKHIMLTIIGPLALFYSFSRFCEIGISLPRL